MATLDYVDIPCGATRLKSISTSKRKTSMSSDIRAAPTVYTSLPNPTPPPRRHTQKQMSISMSAASALTSPTLNFLPQMLLSSAIPAAALEGGAELPANPRQKLDPEKYTLLSTKDPLSLPIMTNNFKRFVSKVGPVFWVQDRVEEIFTWKRGWKTTCTWMAIYTFICFYPKFIFLTPHAALIAIILATYPYPPSGQPFSINASRESTADTLPQSATEGSIPWQANLQAIQNLMGAVSDAFTAAEPHVHHLILSPAHFKDTPPRGSSSRPLSPYTPHILALLLLSFPVLAFVVALPNFPVREVCLVAGLAPFIATHPVVAKLAPFALPIVQRAAPLIQSRALVVQKRIIVLLSILKTGKVWRLRHGLPLPHEEEPAQPTAAKPLSTVIQRIIDNDRLTDKCWNTEMCEVELWENERFGGTGPDAPAPTTGSVLWSKANLKPGERTPWTRGRDGWNGVGSGGMGNSAVEASGEVSSLTFSLAPGWAFVETEDWRKDLLGEWSGVGGADDDGWVYTNDAWLGPRSAPYTAGGGSVTRRRRWTRRVWYDPDLAKQEAA